MKSTPGSSQSLFVHKTIVTKTKPIIASTKGKFYLHNKRPKSSELNSFVVRCYIRCHFSSYFCGSASINKKVLPAVPR